MSEVVRPEGLGRRQPRRAQGADPLRPPVCGQGGPGLSRHARRHRCLQPLPRTRSRAQAGAERARLRRRQPGQHHHADAAQVPSGYGPGMAASRRQARHDLRVVPRRRVPRAAPLQSPDRRVPARRPQAGGRRALCRAIPQLGAGRPEVLADDAAGVEPRPGRDRGAGRVLPEVLCRGSRAHEGLLRQGRARVAGGGGVRRIRRAVPRGTVDPVHAPCAPTSRRLPGGGREAGDPACREGTRAVLPRRVRVLQRDGHPAPPRFRR